MSNSETAHTPDSWQAELVLGFAPLHKRALGTALGLVMGTALFLMTVWAILKGDPTEPMFGLRYLLPLYDVTWGGAVLGSFSAALASFCAGWFFAFCRNLVLAVSIWVLHTRAELAQTRDFLDHI